MTLRGEHERGALADLGRTGRIDRTGGGPARDRGARETWRHAKRRLVILSRVSRQAGTAPSVWITRGLYAAFGAARGDQGTRGAFERVENPESQSYP